HQHHLADLPRVNAFPGRAEALVVAAHESHLEPDAGLAARPDHCVTFSHIHGHRLFTENVLAGARGLDHHITMERGRGHDDYRMDIRIFKGRPIVRVALFDLELFLRCIQGGCMSIHKGREPAAARPAGEVPSVYHAGPAGADHAYSNPSIVPLHAKMLSCP